MLGDKFSIRYTPKFLEDLNEIVDYITYKLHNPDSVMNLVKRIEDAILGRQNCPLAFEPFQSSRKHRYSYYRIYVDNFTIYYVVIDNIMEVRRIFYSGRDSNKIIK